MQSLKSRLVNTLIRNRHFFQGRLRREVFSMNSSIQAFRDLCEKSAAKMSRIPHGVQIEPAEVGGVAAEWIRPDGAPEDKAILYVHGGGYVSWSCADHRGFVATFAKNLGYSALTYNYRLAPEYPYPAALEDSLAVYRALLETYRPEDVLIAGESAGGGLALALLFAIKKLNLSQPCAAAVISPWTDLSCSSPGYYTRNVRSAAPKDSWTVFANHYAADTDRHNPLLSPLFGDPTGMPPILINSATDDELFEDGEEFARQVRDVGGDVVFRAGEGMIHCYPLLAPMFREAVEAMEEISCFVKKHLGR